MHVNSDGFTLENGSGRFLQADLIHPSNLTNGDEKVSLPLETDSDIDNLSDSGLSETSISGIESESDTSTTQSPRLSRNMNEFSLTRQPKALDLFSGTGSVGKRLGELGYEVVSVDIDPKRKPALVENVLFWDFVEQYPRVILI